jgi:hypothetical protein
MVFFDILLLIFRLVEYVFDKTRIFKMYEIELYSLYERGFSMDWRMNFSFVSLWEGVGPCGSREVAVGRFLAAPTIIGQLKSQGNVMRFKK